MPDSSSTTSPDMTLRAKVGPAVRQKVQIILSDVERIRSVFHPPHLALWELLARALHREWRKGDRKPLGMGGVPLLSPEADDQTAWDADGRVRAEFYAFARVARDIIGEQIEGALQHIEKHARAIGENSPANAEPGKLCYPFSTTTCNDPKCSCREEKQMGPLPEPTDQSIAAKGTEFAAWLKWWDTFKGSTHELEAACRAAFLAGRRSAVAPAPDTALMREAAAALAIAVESYSQYRITHEQLCATGGFCESGACEGTTLHGRMIEGFNDLAARLRAAAGGGEE